MFETQCDRSLVPHYKQEKGPLQAILEEEPASRQATLRKKVARIMRRLELTPDEVATLPDAYRDLLKAKIFADHFEPDSPKTPFLPPDLLDDGGPWVAIARDTKTLGASAHLNSVNLRSAFVPYLRVSDHRQDTIDYLRKFQHFDPNVNLGVPVGSQLALLRRMMLPTTSGHAMVTPVIESLQLIVVDSTDDHRFKFVIDRKAIIAGGTALRPLDKNDPMDAYSIEQASTPRRAIMDEKIKSDTDGEPLVLGEYADVPPYRSLNLCSTCHGNTMSQGAQLFGFFFGPTTKPVPMDSAKQISRIIRIKEKSPEWKEYLAERKEIDASDRP